MHSFINHELILALEAELRSRAERDRRVNAVISDRRTKRFCRGPTGITTAIAASNSQEY